MLPYLLLSLEILAMRPVPVGTQLHVRLTSNVGSYASKAGDPISAVLIAPVTAEDQTILPEGSTLTGTVKSVGRVGFGIVRETAKLKLDFDRVTLPDGESFSISARVDEVENGREYVAQDGSIHGVRSTSSLCYRASGYIRMALSWQVHAGLAFWAIKTLIVQVPEPEIYYPAGAELTLSLTESILATGHGPSTGPRGLNQDEKQDLEPLIDALPYRTHTPYKNRPSDLINMMFIGSREQIESAFAAAGWVAARPANLSTGLKDIRAVAEHAGFIAAPMTPLLLNLAEADLSRQKSLNDIAKRHHIRVWKQPVTWNGREIWAAAATRDVDLAFLRPGQTFTHKIESDVDRERDKVANDLVFTGCVDVMDQWERPEVPHLTRNGTGDEISTDANLAVLQFNTCASPRKINLASSPAVRPHGNAFQRLIRRQILSARNDILRDNLYWRGYEGVRWVITAIRQRRQDYDVRQDSTNLAWTPFSRERMGWLW